MTTDIASESRKSDRNFHLQTNNMDEEQEKVEAENETGEVQKTEETKPIEEVFEPIQLAPNLIASNVTLLSRVSTGLEHAFTKLEIHGQHFTHTDNLNLYPHLRFIVHSTNTGSFQEPNHGNQESG
jgi:hypothetical protein